ncbi:MAG: hypothetical protein AB1505_05730 [Candidatus Latescibacterota bacterium]
MPEAPESTTGYALPERLRPLFWDVPFEALTWPRDRDFVVGRVLAQGTWDDIRWLRARVRDEGLSAWILTHAGRGLSPQQLRFWELLLDLPQEQVNAWLADEGRQAWERRTHR